MRIDLKWPEMRSESDFRTSKMAAGGHFVKNFKKLLRSVWIWNGQKCHRKWILDIQNGRSIRNGQKWNRKWSFVKSKMGAEKNIYRSEMAGIIYTWMGSYSTLANTVSSRICIISIIQNCDRYPARGYILFSQILQEVSGQECMVNQRAGHSFYRSWCIETHQYGRQFRSYQKTIYEHRYIPMTDKFKGKLANKSAPRPRFYAHHLVGHCRIVSLHIF